MSFKSPSKKVKSFVTEDEASEINARKQEQWERLRGPEDPLGRWLRQDNKNNHL